MRESLRGTKRSRLWATTLLALFLLPGCDDEDPVRSSPPTITFEAPEPFCSFDNSTCQAPVEISFQVADDLEADSLSFHLEVDLSADGTVDDTPDPGNVLTSEHPDYTVELTLGFGSHELRVEVVEEGGELHEVVIPFSVVDCRAPAPICINGLSVQLQPLPPETDADGDGDIDAAAMTIFATDFIASPVSDCSEPIRYSINRQGASASVDLTSLVLTCDDVGTVLVEIHAFDSAAGLDGGPNHDFCETFVFVQDSQGLCAE